MLIIGAGLSAADAVTICRSSQVHVIHVYRNSSVGLDKMLPEAVYPEYHAVSYYQKQLYGFRTQTHNTAFSKCTFVRIFVNRMLQMFTGT